MTARIYPVEILWRTALFAFAVLLGLIAGVKPELAAAGAVGVAFLLITFSDIRLGLALFVVISFLEMTAIVPGLGLAKVAGGAVGLSWLAKIATNPDRSLYIWSQQPGLTAILVAFLTWIALSVAWAGDPGLALNHSMRYALNAALFPIFYTAIRTPEDAKLILGAFVAGAGVAALMGLITPPDLEKSDTVVRLTSTIGDPNELAATLAAGFVLSIGFSMTRPAGSLSRLVLIVIGLLCVFTLILTVSRGGVLALLAALLLAPIIAKNKIRALAGVVTMLVLVFFYISTLAPAGTVDRLVERDGGSGRTDIWKVATRVINDQPVHGVGVGNFPPASVDYVLQPGALTEKKTLISEPTVAHNMYLEVWAELGTVGLILFLSILGYCFIGVIRAAWRFRAWGERDLSILASSTALALVALMTAYFFLSEQTGNKFWILLALCPCLISLSRRRAQELGPDA